MIELLEVGKETAFQRTWFLLRLSRLLDWPQRIEVGSPNFALFFVIDGRGEPEEEVLPLAKSALRQGAAYVHVWGPNARRIHDLFDKARDEINPEPTDGNVIMTSWDEGDSLEDALFDFARASSPAEDYEDSTGAWLVTVIGEPEWAKDLEKRIRSYVDSP